MNEKLLLADGTEVRENLYLQHGDTLLKVSTVYSRDVSLIVCWENGGPLPRTTVRRATHAAVRTLFTVAGDALVGRYHDYLDGKPRKPLGPMQVHEFEQDRAATP